MSEKSGPSLSCSYLPAEFPVASFPIARSATNAEISPTAAHEVLGVVAATLRDTQARLVKSYAALALAQEAATNRERFIAILVHDLRNSLQSIAFGTEHLRQNLVEQRSLGVVARIERSSDRMAEMIQNVLDLSRGRLSDGFPLELQETSGLAEELQHVIAEVQAAHVLTDIEIDLAVTAPIVCDRHRIAQLLGNLLSNAATHGAPQKSIQVRINGDVDALEISVVNSGPTIPAERLAGLFEAFSHGPENGHQGLGLGLYIAAGIAAAHGGLLTVLSAGDRTCFTFRMPCGQGSTRT